MVLTSTFDRLMSQLRFNVIAIPFAGLDNSLRTFAVNKDVQLNVELSQGLCHVRLCLNPVLSSSVWQACFLERVL